MGLYLGWDCTFQTYLKVHIGSDVLRPIWAWTCSPGLHGHRLEFLEHDFRHMDVVDESRDELASPGCRGESLEVKQSIQCHTEER